jgi:flagellar basal-body rod protein FlgF
LIYGLYLSAQGAEAQSQRLDTIANNLANVGTGAFKRDLAVFQSHPPYDVQNGAAVGLPHGLDSATGGVALAEVATSFAPGPIVETGAALDVALDGDGFLRVADGDEQFLTRNGSLAINAAGELVTTDGGYAVLGPGGTRIAIPEEAQRIDIAADGTLSAVDARGARNAIGQLDLVGPRSLKELQKLGNSLYRPHGEVRSAAATTGVKQGYLELSGTDSTREMMHMIEATRAFETNVNMMKFQDDALARLLESVARR